MNRNPAAPARRAPGGPVLQDEVTVAIMNAFYEELASAGYARLSLEAVAKRAGAGKAAIYRRWSGKQAMVVALVSDLALASIGIPDTGTLRGDVRQFLVNACEALEDPLACRIVPDLLAEAARDAELGQALLSAMRTLRRDKAAHVLQRAVERGELAAGSDADLEIGLDLLAGPLYWRLVVSKEAADDEYFDRLTDKIIGALRA